MFNPHPLGAIEHENKTMKNSFITSYEPIYYNHMKPGTATNV